MSSNIVNLEYKGRGWKAKVSTEKEDTEIGFDGNLSDVFQEKNVYGYLTKDLNTDRDVIVVFLDGKGRNSEVVD